jgi:hypothetical protein
MKINILIILCFLIYGCKQEEFFPIRNYEEKLVLFSVLDSRNDITFLYLQKNSNSWNISDRLSLPEDLQVKVIKNDGKEYIYKDTAITGNTDFKIYYCKNFKPDIGIYTLKITSKNFPELSSTITFPRPCGVRMQYYSDYLMISLNSSPGNYRFRFNIYYEQKIDNAWILKWEEAPITILVGNGIEIMEYPGPNFVEESEKTIKITDKSTNDFINNKILPSAAKDDIRISRGCLIIENYEPNLANYLKSVNGYFDKFTIRLDQFGYSNINNGFGIFGAIMVDTIKIFSRE